MANPDSLAQQTSAVIGNYAIASATGVNLGTTGNADRKSTRLNSSH